MNCGKIFNVLLVSFFPVILSAQSAKLSGEVRMDGKPVLAATVTLDNDLSIITDSSGQFKFDSLTAGHYKIMITMTGAEPYRQTVKLDSGDHKILQINLEPAHAALNEVVVSGTMKAVSRLDSPIPVEVYNQTFFKKNPTPSMFEALQNVNGVRPQLNCNVCNTGDIHINGLEGPYTMITIDGMPIVSSLSSVYGLFGIPNHMIDRVEIVKGPASGLYGSEAIGGLINVITKTPEKAPLFSLQTMANQWQEYLLDAGVKYRLGKKITGLTGIHYFNYDEPKDVNGDNFTDVTLQHRVSVFNKWSLQRKNNRKAQLAARYFYEDRWGGEMQWDKSFRGTDSVYGESIYTSRWEVLGSYQLPVDEEMHFSFSATGHQQDSWYGTTPYMGDQRILFGQMTWNKILNARHNMLLGLASRYNYYDDNTTATVDTFSGINQPEKFFIPGIFIQHEWNPKLNHDVLLGLRYDHHPVHKHIITPRVAYKMKLDDQRTLRVNAGTGFRVVNLFTEDHAALTGARVVEIKEKLKPESSVNINANFMNQWRKVGKYLTIEVSAWYSWFQNQIIPDYETDPQKIIYQNLPGHAVSRGFSVNTEWSWYYRLKGWIGFTVQDVFQVNNKQHQRPLLTEKWSGTWTLSYHFPAIALAVDYTGNIYGSMKLPLQGATDPRRPDSPVWSLQNLQLTKKWGGRVETFAGIKNLLNWTPAKNNIFLIARAHDPFDKQVQFDGDGNVLATPENPYALSFDPAYMYAPNQGRRLFVGLRYTIND